MWGEVVHRQVHHKHEHPERQFFQPLDFLIPLGKSVTVFLGGWARVVGGRRCGVCCACHVAAVGLHVRRNT